MDGRYRAVLDNAREKRLMLKLPSTTAAVDAPAPYLHPPHNPPNIADDA